MNSFSHLLVRLALAFFIVSAVRGKVPSGKPVAPLSPAMIELKELLDKVVLRLEAGARSVEALAPELAEFDRLLVKYPEKNDDGGQIAMYKAVLFVRYLDEAKGRQMLLQLKEDFPGTAVVAHADLMLKRTSPQFREKSAADDAEREAKLAGLIGKPAPEIDFNWSSRTGLKRLSDLRGQVVVVDFWATWCGPCLASFPQIREHVLHFKATPVIILGVTSLQGTVSNLAAGGVKTKGNPELEYELMTRFMREKEMTWDVAFSDEEVFNPNYVVKSIPYVAIIAPDGTVRHARLNPARKDVDIAGKVEAILREFNLPLPKR